MTQTVGETSKEENLGKGLKSEHQLKEGGRSKNLETEQDVQMSCDRCGASSGRTVWCSHRSSSGMSGMFWVCNTGRHGGPC